MTAFGTNLCKACWDWPIFFKKASLLCKELIFLITNGIIHWK